MLLDASLDGELRDSLDGELRDSLDGELFDSLDGELLDSFDGELLDSLGGVLRARLMVGWMFNAASVCVSRWPLASNFCAFWNRFTASWVFLFSTPFAGPGL